MLIHATEHEDLDGANAVMIAAKSHPWKARVTADVLIHVLVGDGVEADGTDYPIPAGAVVDFDVGAGEVVSVFSASPGEVWVATIA